MFTLLMLLAAAAVWYCGYLVGLTRASVWCWRQRQRQARVEIRVRGAEPSLN